jgi:hypothetical protein
MSVCVVMIDSWMERMDAVWALHGVRGYVGVHSLHAPSVDVLLGKTMVY